MERDEQRFSINEIAEVHGVSVEYVRELARSSFHRAKASGMMRDHMNFVAAILTSFVEHVAQTVTSDRKGCNFEVED